MCKHFIPIRSVPRGRARAPQQVLDITYAVEQIATQEDRGYFMGAIKTESRAFCVTGTKAAAVYLCRTLTVASYPEIAAAMERTCHSSLIELFQAYTGRTLRPKTMDIADRIVARYTAIVKESA